MKICDSSHFLEAVSLTEVQFQTLYDFHDI